MKLRNTLVGLTLLGAALSSSALSLGRARGTVVMGQPLDVGIDVRVDSAENAIAQCFRAEVLHGDLTVDTGRVRILVQALGSSPVDVVVRVRSNAVVDEPVVGVVLYTQCGAQASRRYDFLAEFPVEMNVAQIPAAAQVPESGSFSPVPVPAQSPAPPAVVVAAPPAPAPVAAPARTAPPAATVQAPSAAPPAARSAPRRPPKRLVQAPVARPATAAATAKAGSARPSAAAPSARPRLTLDTPSGAGAAALRGTRELASPPTENLPQRAEAAATWRMLNAPAQDGQRLLAVEQREQQDKLAREARETSERDLRARLERAERRLDESESQRIDIAIVYGLIALLLLALALAAYFWNRARKSALEAAHWARVPEPVPPPLTGAAPLPDTGPSRPAPKSSMTADLESVGGALPQSGAARAGATYVAAGVATVPVATAVLAKRPAESVLPRELNPEEFFDAQQHADFFVSLGQYDQAVDVLKRHIADYGVSSPLAFLELFKLYHTLSRQSDFNALREEFQTLFNARVPNFAAFTDEGLDLVDYPAALLSIETAWGHARVLDTIEANIVRAPGDTGKPFDLAAFGDLLMLYAVARIALSPDDETLGSGSGFSRSGLRGLDDGGSLLPPRAGRPDFSASLTPSDPRHAALAAAAAAGAAAVASAPAAPAPMDLELDSSPVPLSTPNYDDSLDLDLSISQRHALEAGDSVADAHPTVPNVSEVDIDLPLLEMDDAEPPASDAAAPPKAPADAAAKPALDSGMIDFDLFDPNTEAQIAPKSTR